MRKMIRLSLAVVIGFNATSISRADETRPEKPIASQEATIKPSDLDDVTEEVETAAADKEMEAIETAEDAKATAPIEATKEVAVEEQWKPRQIVTLFRAPGGEPKHTKKTARVPYYTLSYQDVNRGGNTERVEVRQLAYRDQEVTVASPGTATLYCDEFSLKLSGESSETKYDLECPGRLKLQIDGMQIDCDSGKLSDGKLQLENAPFAIRGTVVTSAQMAIHLDIKGIRTADFGMVPPEGLDLQPPPYGVVTPLRPHPQNSYQPVPDDKFREGKEPAGEDFDGAFGREEEPSDRSFRRTRSSQQNQPEFFPRPQFSPANTLN